MRNKNAKELIKIIRLLISNDDESALLGLALFENHYLLTGLNKHKKFKVSCSWPGWSDQKPKRFDGYSSNRSREFTKKEFIKEIYFDNKLNLNAKILLVLNFIKDSTNGYVGNRNKNQHIRDIFYDLNRTDKEIFKLIKIGKVGCYLADITKEYQEAYSEFIKELDEYGGNSTLYRVNNSGINNHILDYKLYLQKRYRKNKGKFDYLYNLKSLFKSEEEFKAYLSEYLGKNFKLF